MNEYAVRSQPVPLLDVPAVAELLNLDVRAVYRLRASGSLPAPLKIGRKLRWRRADVEAWLQSRQEVA